MTDHEDDPFIPIWEGPTVDAELIRLHLEESHVPVEFGDALLVGHARVQVPRSYLAEANDVLSGRQTTWPPELTAKSEDSLGLRPAMRIIFALVALGLIVLFVWGGLSV